MYVCIRLHTGTNAYYLSKNSILYEYYNNPTSVNKQLTKCKQAADQNVNKQMTKM